MSGTQPAPKPGPRSLFGPEAAWRRTLWGDAVSEFAGTFILVLIGCGSVAMTVAALNQSGRGPNPFDASADWLVIAWGWGFAVVFGVYVAGGITGAHINPAVTLAFALKRGFPWRKVPAYWAAQIAGAFGGAAIVYWAYAPAIESFERARNITRGTVESIPTFSIFATFPAQYLGDWFGPFFDQVIGTAILVALVFALVDNFNVAPKANIAPLLIGFVVVAIGLSFGANAGYAINPARDLGPRLIAWIEGWKEIAIPGNYGNINSYMWIPIVGPLVGGAVGAYAYDFFAGHVLRARHVVPEEGVFSPREVPTEAVGPVRRVASDDPGAGDGEAAGGGSDPPGQGSR